MTLITKKNEVFLRVDADPHIHQELSDYFTFEVPNAKFLQKQRRYKYWDGKIRLYSPGNGELYVGLYDYLVEWLDKKGYNYNIQSNKQYGEPNEEEEFVTPESVASFVRGLNLPFKIRGYQLRGLYCSIKYNRRLLLSPTGSGKSLIIYTLIRWHLFHERNILIIGPRELTGTHHD